MFELSMQDAVITNGIHKRARNPDMLFLAHTIQMYNVTESFLSFLVS
jgi:hypothetical protein